MDDVKSFLKRNLLDHLVSNMIEQEITLEILKEANDVELSLLVPKLVDKIKLRRALEKFRVSQIDSCETQVSLPVRETTTICFEVPQINQDQEDQTLNPIPTIATPPPAPPPLSAQTSASSSATNADLVDWGSISHNWSVCSLDVLNSSDLDILKSSNFELSHTENLRQLLTTVSVGKILLAKANTGEKLNDRDRSLLVKVIVEAELQKIDLSNQCIRKDVWQKWAKEVVNVFQEEHVEVFYVPYHVVDGKVIQASGLFHNRLITHRRYLNSLKINKRGKSSSEDSSDSSNKSYERKRVRPLPEQDSGLPAKNINGNLEAIEWLKSACSPQDMLINKWNSTLKFRQDLIARIPTIKEYFSTFLGLKQPLGYKLLSNDFEVVYPNAMKTFYEKFPIIKNKLLTLLTQKSDTIRPDQNTLDLLDLASQTEECANLAAFLSITSLLRHMPAISVPKKKLWKLSREEVRSGFISKVTSAADIERCCADRGALLTARGIPEQPYIIAVGPSWSKIEQYEIVVFNGLRYQRKTICEAVVSAYQIYWALDCAYSKDSEPCWMFIQRAMFAMKSKYDTEGVPLRELLFKIESE